MVPHRPAGRQVFDIVPRADRTAAGAIVDRMPLLDTVISLARARQNGLELLEAVARALSETRGEAVKIGTVPVNLQAQVSSTVSDEPMQARRLLGTQLFRPDHNLSWQLLTHPHLERSCSTSTGPGSPRLPVRGYLTV